MRIHKSSDTLRRIFAILKLKYALFRLFVKSKRGKAEKKDEKEEALAQRRLRIGKEVQYSQCLGECRFDEAKLTRERNSLQLYLHFSVLLSHTFLVLFTFFISFAHLSNINLCAIFSHKLQMLYYTSTMVYRKIFLKGIVCGNHFYSKNSCPLTTYSTLLFHYIHAL